MQDRPPCPRCQELEAHIERLEQRIQKLEQALEKTLRAGKRQAAPFSKGAPKAHPKKPGRKPGKDYGPKAHRQPPAEVDETYEAPLPEACPHCGSAEVTFEKTVDQYQEEIPRKPIRRRFLIGVGHCTHCRRRLQGRHPLQTSDALGAAASQIGPEAQALAVQLNKVMGASHGKIARFFQTTFGIGLSRGGCAQIMLRAAQRCGTAYRDILVFIRGSASVTPDETGWKVGGRLQWLWVFATPEATGYIIRPSRGADVPLDILGQDYAGGLTRDGWAPYDRLMNAAHQLCLGHLLVRCGKLLEAARGRAVCFPRAVQEILKKALALRDRRDGESISLHGLAVATGRLENRLLDLLARRITHADNERLANHLAQHFGQLFTFLHVPGVDATNWRAEQAIRPAVVNRKVWGGSRTETGAEAQSCLMSVLRTCALQGRDALAFLSATLRAPPGAQPRLNLIAEPI